MWESAQHRALEAGACLIWRKIPISRTMPCAKWDNGGGEHPLAALPRAVSSGKPSSCKSASLSGTIPTRVEVPPFRFPPIKSMPLGDGYNQRRWLLSRRRRSLRTVTDSRYLARSVSRICYVERGRVLNCREIAISNNVCGVKHVFEHSSVCTHRRAPFRSRCGLRVSNLGSL